MSQDPDANRRGWARRTRKFSPSYYADIGANEVSETLVTVFDHYLPPAARILEVGCSSGRHLEQLRQAGRYQLAGIDLNPDAFSVMRERYPTLAREGQFCVGAIETLVPMFEDRWFDAVYSVETLQHVHPDDTAVFDRLKRVTDDLLVTAENEGNGPDRGRRQTSLSMVDDGAEEFPLFYRDWYREFTDLGMAQLLVEPGARDTIRVFRRA